MAPKLRTRGSLVRKIQPPQQKNERKKRDIKDRVCFTSAKTNKKEEEGAGGRLGVVTLQSNE